MGCKDICKKLKAKKPQTGSRYGNGQKRCQVCEIFIMWEGYFCPCCKYRLRSKPRSSANKLKLREKMPNAF